MKSKIYLMLPLSPIVKRFHLSLPYTLKTLLLCVKHTGDTHMATNLAIDDVLIEEAKAIGKHRTKKGVVTEALEEYIQRRKQTEIFNIFNKIDYDSDYDYKQQRSVK